MSGQIGAAISTPRTLDQSAVPAESAFVTAFGLSVVAAALAAVVSVTIDARRLRGLSPAEAVE